MSMRVAWCCSFFILEFSGGLTAISTESDVGGPCANNQLPASHTHRGLCVPLPSLVLLGGPLSLVSWWMSLGFVFMHYMLWQTLGSPGNGTEAVFYLSTTSMVGITWALQSSSGVPHRNGAGCMWSSCFSDMRGLLKLDLQVFPTLCFPGNSLFYWESWNKLRSLSSAFHTPGMYLAS